MPYTLIDHTADIGVKVSAPTLEGLFEEAAYALADIMGGLCPEGTEEVPIETRGYDQEDLFVRWLQEILYAMEVKGWRLKRALVQDLTDKEVQGRLIGAYAHTPLTTEIKAVTYHNLEIRHIDNAFEATIILDM